MQEPRLFQIFIDKLNNLQIPYMVTGSVASIVYGEPRLTHDIDIVLTFPLNFIDKFCSSFPDSDFYCPPKDIIRDEILRENRGHCNIIHYKSGFKADIYFAGNDNFQHWALENIKIFKFHKIKIPIAPPEYVIIKKLEFYKEGNATKHITDIRAIIKYSYELLNISLLETYIKQFGLQNQWEFCTQQ